MVTTLMHPIDVPLGDAPLMAKTTAWLDDMRLYESEVYKPLCDRKLYL